MVGVAGRQRAPESAALPQASGLPPGRARARARAHSAALLSAHPADGDRGAAAAVPRAYRAREARQRAASALRVGRAALLRAGLAGGARRRSAAGAPPPPPPPGTPPLPQTGQTAGPRTGGAAVSSSGAAWRRACRPGSDGARGHAGASRDALGPPRCPCPNSPSLFRLHLSHLHPPSTRLPPPRPKRLCLVAWPSQGLPKHLSRALRLPPLPSPPQEEMPSFLLPARRVPSFLHKSMGRLPPPAPHHAWDARASSS